MHTFCRIIYSVEELCRLINDKIYSSTREGYGIFYEDELLDVLPESERTRETLEAVLKKLTKGGYADVKYAKGNAFCIIGLKVYEPEDSQPDEDPSAQSEPLQAAFKKKLLRAIFFASFAGGALGSFIFGLIAHAF